MGGRRRVRRPRPHRRCSTADGFVRPRTRRPPPRRSAAAGRSPTRWPPSRRCSRPRPRPSSSCLHATAGRARSTRSTTSPSWPGWTARPSRSRRSAAAGTRPRAAWSARSGRSSRTAVRQAGQSDLFPNVGRCVDDMAFVHSLYAESADPRVGPADDEQRPHAERQPVPRRSVGDLRPRQREREPARLRGHAGQDRRADQRAEELEQRLHAGGVPGRDLAGRQDADPRPRPAARVHPRAAAVAARPAEGEERGPPGRRAGRDNSELAARIASYELAFKMQQHAPEAVDFAQETAGDAGAVRH